MKDNAVAQISRTDLEGEAVGVGKLVISVLGTPTMEVDGAPGKVDTRKAIALLVYLAATGRTQSRERLAGLLWPEFDQDHARAALRRTLSALKKALGGRWVSADRLGVSLDPKNVEFDLAAFRSTLEGVATHEHSPDNPCYECIRALMAAVHLVGGPFMQGFSLRDAEPFEEWQSLETESVERELAGALDKLVRAHTSAGDLEAAVEVAQRKVGIDPLDEPARRQLMQLYAWRGMRAASLQQYRECVAVLDRELGVAPLLETKALYDAIVGGEVAPHEGVELPQPAAPVEGSGPDTYPLRGRAEEWASLFEVLSGLGDGGALVVLEGEAGIGKTRLAQDFLQVVGASGASTVAVRSHEGEGGLAYALITKLLERLDERALGGADPKALAEASRLVPALQPPGFAPGPIDEPGAITRFFEGVRKVLMAGVEGPVSGVVLLDDLHWCDGASLDLLGYIYRRLDETPICFIAGWRAEEVTQDHHLRRLASEARPSRSILLQRLGYDDVRELLADVTDKPSSEVADIAQRLMQETEGIPFFVVEYLRAMSGAEQDDWQVPSSITELLRSRAALVGQTARQILGTAAVIDRSFDFDTVWRASGRTELEAVDALDELVRHRLVITGTASTDAEYEFSHEKLRAFVYEAMSPARRRMLHRRVAEAFVAASRRQEHLMSMSALIARHLQIAGIDTEAAKYHEMAARHSRSVFANREALDHYHAALGLAYPDPAALHEGAGDMYVLLGEYQKAIDSYQAATPRAEEEVVPQIEYKLGEVHLRRGAWELSQSHFQVALEAVTSDEDGVSRARLLAAMSFNALRKDDIDAAMDLARQALTAAMQSGDPRALAEAYNQLGILENARGRHSEAVEYLEKSLASAIEGGDVAGRAAALNNLARAARSRGDLDHALRLTNEALDICAQQGDSHREAALHNNVADLLHEKGETEAAMDHLKTATTILAKIGTEPTGMLPEVWKLIEW